MDWIERKKTYDKHVVMQRRLSSFMVAAVVFLTTFTVLFVVVLPDVVEAAGESWFGVNGYNHYSSSGTDAEAALNGTGIWTQISDPEDNPWLIIDLNRTYTIRQVRGRSSSDSDPIDVTIYVSNDPSSWGEGEALESGVWVDTGSWVNVEMADACGRYIKIEVFNTEQEGLLTFGSAKGGSILDVYTEDYASMNIYPDQDGRTTVWDVIPPTGPSTHHAAVADLSDLSWVYVSDHGAGNEEEDFFFYVEPSLLDVAISNLRLVARMKGDSVLNTVNLGLYAEGVRVAGAENQALTTSYSPFYESWQINPRTLKPWTFLDLDVSVEASLHAVAYGSLEHLTYCSEVYAEVSYVEANFTVTSINVNNSETITFNGSSSKGDVNWSWDLDNDGNPDAYGETLTDSYSKAGIYNVNLTVNDGNGFSDTKSGGLQITVKQKIDLVRNANNNGLNYVTWGANESVLASRLAYDLGLSDDDFIYKFNPSSGDWTSIAYDCGQDIGDFTIYRWDHIAFQISESTGDVSYSFTPDSGTEITQNLAMKFNSSDRGFNFITWSNDFNITLSSLHSQIAADDYISYKVYNPTTDTWRSYSPGLPPGFPNNDDFYIEPYDVISVNAGIGHDNVVYDTSSIT